MRDCIRGRLMRPVSSSGGNLNNAVSGGGLLFQETFGLVDFNEFLDDKFKPFVQMFSELASKVDLLLAERSEMLRKVRALEGEVISLRRRELLLLETSSSPPPGHRQLMDGEDDSRTEECVKSNNSTEGVVLSRSPPTAYSSSSTNGVSNKVVVLRQQGVVEEEEEEDNRHQSTAAAEERWLFSCRMNVSQMSLTRKLGFSHSDLLVLNCAAWESESDMWDDFTHRVVPSAQTADTESTTVETAVLSFLSVDCLLLLKGVPSRSVASHNPESIRRVAVLLAAICDVWNSRGDDENFGKVAVVLQGDEVGTKMRAGAHKLRIEHLPHFS